MYNLYVLACLNCPENQVPQLNSLESYHLSEMYGKVWYIIDILLCELHSRTASVQFLIMNGMCYYPVKVYVSRLEQFLRFVFARQYL